MNVKTTFFFLDEKIYMKQLKRFILPRNEKKVCKLVKSLYDLKKAPKQWHEEFNSIILSQDF